MDWLHDWVIDWEGFMSWLTEVAMATLTVNMFSNTLLSILPIAVFSCFVTFKRTIPRPLIKLTDS